MVRYKSEFTSMPVSCHLREKITSKATFGFEITIGKKNHFYGLRDLTTRPCNIWHNSTENIYFIFISKDGDM